MLVEYEKGITQLVNIFGQELQKGRILGLVPFIPVLKTLISGKPVPHIRCGSGRDSFTVLSNGRI
jgi:hypothetical protein